MPDTSYSLRINGSPTDQDLLDAISLVEVLDDAVLASAFRLRIPIGLTGDGDWTWLTDHRFQPLTNIAIAVQLGSAVDEQLMYGYITGQTVHFQEQPGMSTLEVTGMDATTLMNLDQKVVTWTNMADSDIATQIFSSYGFTPQVDSTQPSYNEDDVTIMQRGTDYSFLRRLARRNGFECFLETDATGTTTGHFHVPTLSGEPQKTLALAFGEDTNVTALEARYDALRPATAEAHGLTLTDKADQSATSTSSSLQTLGATSALDLLSTKPNTLVARSGAYDQVELQTRAQAAVDASSWAVSMTGEVDATAYQAVIRSRRSILLRGAGTRYSGTYYVSRVTHSLTKERYTQRFELTRNALGLSGSEPFAAGAGLSLASALG
jgi:phage protein D